MPEEPRGEKVLPASPRKRERAREQGNVARSMDLNSAVVLLAGIFAFLLAGPTLLYVLIAAVQEFLGRSSEAPRQIDNLQGLTLEALGYLAYAVAPVLLVLLLAGVAVNLLQTGFLLTGYPLVPRLERINPFTGMQRLFSLRGMVELVKAVLKLAIAAVIVWFTFRNALDDIVSMMSLTPYGFLAALGSWTLAIWWRMALLLLVLGILDYGFQYWQREQDLRMTREEAMQELRELEGDPRVRQRIRRLQREMAMRRMMQEVPKADVVITNPVEYAVALRYDFQRMRAPVVVAKGARLMAQRIREVAEEHRVPIVQRPELARLLYRTVEVGQSIAEDLFRAVAEVLAFVYRIDQREEKRREREAFFGRAA